MLDSLDVIPDLLPRSIVGRTWRTKPDYFKAESLSGCLEFAPAMHQLGHSVSCLRLLSPYLISM